MNRLAAGLVLLLPASFLCTASAVCLDPGTFVSGYKVPIALEVRTADAIVIGRVLSQEGLREDTADPEGYTGYNVKVKVTTRLKGDLPDVVVISDENTSARYPMAVGEEHLLFVSRDGAKLWVNSCGNSSTMPKGKRLLARVQAQLHGRK